MDDAPLELNSQEIQATEKFRRQKSTAVLTVMFTDLARSTDLREELGEIAYEDLRSRHDELVYQSISEGGAGTVIKSTGDGVLAVFAEPSVAVERALMIQERTRSEERLELRIGLDMGQVSREMDGGVVRDVFGRQVNRAARIQSAAEPRHTLVSFQVYDCAVGWLRSPEIRWLSHGPISLKGFAEPVWLHEVFNPLTSCSQPILTSKEYIERLLAARHNRLRRASPIASSPASSRAPSGSPERRRSFSLPRLLRQWWQRALGSSPPVAQASAVFKIADQPRFGGRGKFIDLQEPIPGEDPETFYANKLQVLLRGSSYRVLWVDDYPNNNLSVRGILLNAGCEVDLALSTSEAKQKLKNSVQYGLVISDVGRAESASAGLNLLAWLRQQRIAVPTIIFTSEPQVLRTRDRALELGAIECTSGFITLLGIIHDAVISHVFRERMKQRQGLNKG